MSKGPISAPDDDAAASGIGKLSTSELPEPLQSDVQGSFRVLVTGADGFIGRHFLPRLISRGHRVRALVRKIPTRPGAAVPGIEWRVADLTERNTLEGVAEGCDRAVHLAGSFATADGVRLGKLHGTGTRNLVRELVSSDIDRVVLVSALGASPDGGAFFRSKFEAEDIVMSCGREYVILRPSIVYGPGDHFTEPIAGILRMLP
ncbi:MAG: NAD(P)H-binding protein [Gemmatimonadota bacterium]